MYYKDFQSALIIKLFDSVLTDVLYVWVEFRKEDIIYVPAVNTAVGATMPNSCRQSACLAT